ncbi:MAG TPA: universal stress protein [Planctomycetaceae bacterium]|jgi:nucleotide-binding universal stress UspA family protein|nr:universal stress protein [Planctomycetaceae bacterium]
MRPIKTILYASDESEESRSAFRVASALAKDCDARLVIIEVVPPAVTIYGPASEGYLKQMRKSIEKLQIDDPEVCVERRVVEGLPAAEILRAAEEIKCDLILMATHGRTELKRIILGSVAEMVMRGARCPVLVIKTPDFPQQASETRSQSTDIPVKALKARGPRASSPEKIELDSSR